MSESSLESSISSLSNKSQQQQEENKNCKSAKIVEVKSDKKQLSSGKKQAADADDPGDQPVQVKS